MPTPHALYSKMLAERTASRNVLVLFYFIYVPVVRPGVNPIEAEAARGRIIRFLLRRGRRGWFWSVSRTSSWVQLPPVLDEVMFL